MVERASVGELESNTFSVLGAPTSSEGEGCTKVSVCVRIYARSATLALLGELAIRTSIQYLGPGTTTPRVGVFESDTTTISISLHCTPRGSSICAGRCCVSRI